MPCGGGIYGGQTHSQSPEALFTHVCGLRTVLPSNPYDAKGLLISSIENDDPVIFLEPKRLYNGPFDGHHDRPVVPWSKHPMGEVPEGYYTVPLESAKVFRPGEDVTVIAYGSMVFVSEAAANESGVDAEIIDLRSIWPLDLDTILESVKKTGRCVIVHEATKTSGFGAELLSLVQENCFHYLEAPIERVTGWDTPYPHAQEWAYFPGPERIAGRHRGRGADPRRRDDRQGERRDPLQRGRQGAVALRQARRRDRRRRRDHPPGSRGQGECEGRRARSGVPGAEGRHHRNAAAAAEGAIDPPRRLLAPAHRFVAPA
jgi:hypothetical protein